MLFTLEALDAEQGDCLLVHYGTRADHHLVLVDGGPSRTHPRTLRPRLLQLRGELGLPPGRPVPLELVVVTHTDSDHIGGILELVRELVAAKEAQEPALVRIHRLWHNAYGDDPQHLDRSTGKVKAKVAEAVRSELAVHAASLAEGQQLRDAVVTLGLQGNAPFNGMVRVGGTARPSWTLDREHALRVTVVGPGETELAGYRAAWRKWRKDARARGKVTPTGYDDDSAPNLASIATLVDMGPPDDCWRMLLTGDARGDSLLEGLAQAGCLDDDGCLDVNVLKLPHHGSLRNVGADLFERVTADHYVVSANGTDGNPDVGTLELLAEARGEAEISLHLTFPERAWEGVVGTAKGERERRAALKAIDAWLAEHCPEAWTVCYREPDARSIAVELGDEGL